MKQFSYILAVLLMTGSAGANGVGFTGIGSSARLHSDSPQTEEAFAFRANLPTFQTKSNRLNPIESASGYMSSRWGPGYAVPIQSRRVRARLRIVIVDQTPYAVAGKIKAGLRGGFMGPKAYAQELLPQVEAASGCQARGDYYVKQSSYSISKITFALNC